MYFYIWRHSKSFSSWSMLDEPHIYKEQYLQADVTVLAASQTEALAILAQSDTWSIEDLQRRMSFLAVHPRRSTGVSPFLKASSLPWSVD